MEEKGRAILGNKKTCWLLCVFFILFHTNSYAVDEITAKALGGVYPEYPKIDYGTGEEAELVKRGEYLARMGDCLACHSHPADNLAAFAGGPAINTPFGKFYGPNITPDKKTGIGLWSEEEFIKAMTEGLSPEGENYFPVFPYVNFSKMSRSDLKALWAYMQKIPAVEQKSRPHDVPFPFNVRLSVYGWKMLYFYPVKGEYKYEPDQTQEWNRGKYLTEGLGHCGMCHTPINLMGGPKERYHLTGNFIDGYWAPNITGEGLKHASIEDIVEVFRGGKLTTGAGVVAAPMAEVIHNSLGKLTPADQKAIAVYLKTVQSEQPMGLSPSDRQPTLKRGRKVYDKACAVCHQYGQASAPRLGDGPYWLKRAKQGRDALYRHTINGFNNMPTMGGCVTCSDYDIRSAVDYILYKSLTRSQLKVLDGAHAAKKPSISDGKKIYNDICSACHKDGRLGAPKIGDHKAWKPIIHKGMDVIIRRTIEGSYRMPKMGGCSYCTTSDVIAAVKYIVQESVPKGEGDYTLW